MDSGSRCIGKLPVQLRQHFGSFACETAYALGDVAPAATDRASAARPAK